MVRVDPPIVVPWPFRDYPWRVELGGKLFVRSSGLPRARVVAHYREHVPRRSAHLFVLEDGRAIVDHLDDENPHFDVWGHLASDVI